METAFLTFLIKTSYYTRQRLQPVSGWLDGSFGITDPITVGLNTCGCHIVEYRNHCWWCCKYWRVFSDDCIKTVSILYKQPCVISGGDLLSFFVIDDWFCLWTLKRNVFTSTYICKFSFRTKHDLLFSMRQCQMENKNISYTRAISVLSYATWQIWPCPNSPIISQHNY